MTFRVWMEEGERVVPIDGKPTMNGHAPRLDRPPLRAWRPIIEEICRRHRVTWREFVRGYMDRRYVLCRREVWWTLRTKFGASYPEIGRRTGGFDHTTVIHAVKKYQPIERKAA